MGLCADMKDRCQSQVGKNRFRDGGKLLPADPSAGTQRCGPSKAAMLHLNGGCIVQRRFKLMRVLFGQEVLETGCLATFSR